MRARIAVVVLVLAVVSLSVTALAQQRAGEQRPPQAPPTANIKDSPVAKFVGTWKGTASHSMPGQPEPSKVEMVETVEWRMGETALLIEGRGVMKDETGAEKVVHDALAVIRYEPRSNKLMFHAFKVGEPANVSELEVLGDGNMRWFIEPAPGAKVRFTINLTDDTWTEIGEFSRDGGVTYMPFMEMNLKRVK